MIKIIVLKNVERERACNWNGVVMKVGGWKEICVNFCLITVYQRWSGSLVGFRGDGWPKMPPDKRVHVHTLHRVRSRLNPWSL